MKMKRKLMSLSLAGLLGFTVVLSACEPAVPHPIEGRGDCISCHGTNGVKPYPQWHAERTSEVRGNDTCMNCHKLAANASGQDQANSDLWIQLNTR